MIRHRAARWLGVATFGLTLIGCQQGIEHAETSPPGTAAVMDVALSAPPDSIAAPVEIPVTTLAPEPVPAEMVAPYQPPTTTTTTTTAPPPPEPEPAPPVRTFRAAAAPSAPAIREAAPPPPAAPPIDNAGASALTAMTNDVRASVGLAPLGRDGSLDALAADWAQELASSGRLRHSSIPKSIIGKPWTAVGENVGVGPSVGVVHSALVASAGHYANITGANYTRVGIGVAVDASGQVWVCEVFGG